MKTSKTVLLIISFALLSIDIDLAIAARGDNVYPVQVSMIQGGESNFSTDNLKKHDEKYWLTTAAKAKWYHLNYTIEGFIYFAPADQRKMQIIWFHTVFESFAGSDVEIWLTYTDNTSSQIMRIEKGLSSVTPDQVKAVKKIHFKETQIGGFKVYWDKVQAVTDE